MKVLLILILASLGVALFFLAVFVWAVRSGQYEDTTTPSMRLLMEDDPIGTSRGKTAADAGSREEARHRVLQRVRMKSGKTYEQ